jgi:hypothetical protein
MGPLNSPPVPPHKRRAETEPRPSGCVFARQPVDQLGGGYDLPTRPRCLAGAPDVLPAFGIEKKLALQLDPLALALAGVPRRKSADGGRHPGACICNSNDHILSCLDVLIFGRIALIEIGIRGFDRERTTSLAMASRALTAS